MRIVTIVGARPQFVKAAAVSRAMRGTHGLTEIVVHTGQHYDYQMSQVFFDEMEIPQPDHHLGVGTGSHGAQTAGMLAGIEAVLMKERPDAVLVYGDTNSTLAGALAAAKLHLPVAHVEAGLRSYNRRMPEEVNRVLTDHLATLLFAPSESASRNLLKEGIPEGQIHCVGDVMMDATAYYTAIAEAKSRILERLGLETKGYILATVHRAEATDDPACLGAIFDALNAVARDRTLVIPLHPRTRKALEAAGKLEQLSSTATVVEPLGYFDMMLLEKHAALIVTDSGGVQREAYFHGVPCLVLREETEWVELVAAGATRLLAPDRVERLPVEIDGMLSAERTAQPFLYGDGNSSRMVVSALHEARPMVRG